MNMQLFEKIDGLIGISVLLLLSVALIASQAEAELGAGDSAGNVVQGVTTANMPAMETAPGAAMATKAAGAELSISIDASHAESLVEAVGSLIITAAVKDAD